MQSLLYLILSMVLFSFIVNPCNSIVQNEAASDSGIEGTVLRGPTCPVVIENDPCPDEPFSALFHVFSEDGKEVATFRSDEEGHFRVVLEPGHYTIVADESAPLQPPRQAKTVDVDANEFADVTLVFDTGIR